MKSEKRKMKNGGGLCFVLVSLFLMAGCGRGGYKDGSFSAESSRDDTGAWGVVGITITDGKISDVVFTSYQKDGTVKGEDYGKVNGEISNQSYYDKAQLAVRAMKAYEEQFKSSGRIDSVDAVTGATVSFNQFVEAAEAALEMAKK
jgi:major membrane immunogen (membrane-anchored lipoprotein)